MTAHGKISPAEFQVMLALVDGPKHGRGIKVDVRDRTGGSIDMGPGTLYGAIKRLLERGWIAETASELKGAAPDGRLRTYEATTAGREVARAEARRLAMLLDIAVDKALIGG